MVNVVSFKDKGCIALHSRMIHFSYGKHKLCISKPYKYTYQQGDKATAFREKVSKGQPYQTYDVSSLEPGYLDVHCIILSISYVAYL